jgi:hypothetical protein
MMQIIIWPMPREAFLSRLAPPSSFRAKRARYRPFPRDVAMPSLARAAGPQARTDDGSGFPTEAKTQEREKQPSDGQSTRKKNKVL